MPVEVCQTCGFENPEGFRWCGQCGRQLAPAGQPAERRQLTALFCDIVESTALVTRLDVEEARAVFAEFHTLVNSVVQQHGGTVARYLGDGVVAYFGWPRAIEGSAVAAVQAALALQARTASGGPVRVRVGVHTGLAVAGSSATQEVSGPLLHVAARLQEIAPTGGVVVSGETERLIRGRFVADDLGFVPLKGLRDPQRVFRVTAETDARHPLDASRGFPLTPLVGRAAAMQRLMENWQTVREGGAAMILMSGEPGVGKSRMVRAFREQVSEVAHRWLETAAIETGRDVAFEPLIEMGRHLFGYEAGATDDDRSRRIGLMLESLALSPAEHGPVLAALFGIQSGDATAPPRFTPERLRERGMALLVELCRRRAAQLPVIFVLEDLHWADPSTRAFVRALCAARPPGLLLLATARTEFDEPWAGETVVLERLSPADSATVILAVCGGRPLPEVATREIVRSADGVPLFLEEITRAVIESDAVTDCGSYFTVSSQQLELALPATLRDPLRARLDRLGAAREVAQVAAVIGREFAPELIRAVWTRGSAAELDAQIDRLVAAGILRWRGERLDFHHALVQREACESTLLTTRREYHRAVVRALDEQFPAVLRDQPAFAAHHLVCAGCPERAVPLLIEAARQAIGRHAHLEAGGLFRAALAALRSLPESPARLAREGAILLGLLRSLVAVNGYAAPETHQVCEQARALAAAQEPGPSSFDIAAAIAMFYATRAEYAKALDLLAGYRAGWGADRPVVQAGWMVVEEMIAFCQGRFRDADACALRAVALYQPSKSDAISGTVDFKTVALSWRWMTLAAIGLPETGARCMAEAIAHSQEIGAVETIAHARYWALTGSMVLHDFEAVAGAAPANLEFCREYCLSVPLALTEILYGCALAHLGHADEGLAQARQCYAGWLATGMRIAATGHQQRIAEASLAAGRPDLCREALAESARLLAPGEEHWMRAELARTEALLALQSGDSARAIEGLLDAIRIARGQGARWFELRAAVPLARLWLESGDRLRAAELLAPLHAGFAEGRDRKEWREAGELLAASGHSPPSRRDTGNYTARRHKL